MSLSYLAITLIAVFFSTLPHANFSHIVTVYSLGFLGLSMLNFSEYLNKLPKSDREDFSLKTHIKTHYWESSFSKIYMFELGALSVAMFMLAALEISN